MSKNIKWISFSNKDNKIFLSNFIDSDIKFVTIKNTDSSKHEKLLLNGFIYCSGYYFKSGSLFTESEIREIFPDCILVDVPIEETRFKFKNSIPDILKLNNSLEKSVPATRYENKTVFGEFSQINDYQVLYKPASKYGTPIAAIPINFAKGSSQALSMISESVGDIDNWVASELGYLNAEDMSQYLSPEQVDAVAVAIKNAEEGSGSICADATGLGKGRVGAALARWAILKNKKFVFVTEKANLFTDFWRDIIDTNSAEIVGFPFILNNNAKIIDQSDGEVLFSSLKPAENKTIIESMEVPKEHKWVALTYSQLNSKEGAKSKWFEMICENAHLHLDECHNAAGTDSNTNTTVSSGMSKASSFSFSSATYARNAANLSIYSPVLPKSITSLENMTEVLSAGGNPLLEALSQSLSATGRLVRREHDLTDMTINLVIDKKRSELHEDYSDKLAPILSDVSRLAMEIDNLLEDRSSNGYKDHPRGKWYSVHWGTRLSAITKQFVTACKIDLCVDVAVKHLLENKKPTIVIEHTMESLIRELFDQDIKKSEDLQDFFGGNKIPTFKDILRVLVQRTLSVKLKAGKDSPQNIEIDDPKIIMESERILTLIEDFPDLPLSPIDTIMDKIEKEGLKYYKAGIIDRPWKMDEISARSICINNTGIKTMKPVDRNIVISEFQNGKTDGLVLTRAASTGLSLHAHGKCKDQRVRTMNEVQIPQNVVERVQFWGRIKRRGGVNEPEFYCLSTDLSFELRSLAIQNRKVAELSANVTGSSNAAVSMDVPDPINSLGNQIAKRFFEDHKDIARKMGVSLRIDDETSESELYFVNRLLSRLSLLISAEREYVYNQFLDTYSEAEFDMKKRGLHPTQPRELDGSWTILKEEIFEPGNPIDGPIFGAPVYLTTISKDVILSPIDEDYLQYQIKENIDNLYKTYKADSLSSAHSNILEFLQKEQPNILKKVLPKKYSSVIEALNTKEMNMVKKEASKIKSIKNLINNLEFGDTIILSDEAGESKVSGVILDLSVPKHEENFTKPSQFYITYVLPGDEKPRRSSFSTLESDARFAIEKNVHKKTIQMFPSFRNLPTGRTKVERMILNGNAFMAVKSSVDKQLGSSCRIKLDNGETITAILIPKSKQNYLSHFPVTTHIPEVALSILSDGGEVFTNPVEKNKGLLAVRDGPRIKLKLSGNKTETKAFLDQSVIDIVGEFNGEWNKFAYISPEQFLSLAPVLMNKGISFSFPGHYRDYANSIANQIPDKTNSM